MTIRKKYLKASFHFSVSLLSELYFRQPVNKARYRKTIAQIPVFITEVAYLFLLFSENRENGVLEFLLQALHACSVSSTSCQHHRGKA